jgi:hypothetical protein
LSVWASGNAGDPPGSTTRLGGACGFTGNGRSENQHGQYS